MANAVVFSNAVEQTRIIKKLKRDGWKISREDVEVLSPYVTAHIKRFGDYLIEYEAIPAPFDTELSLED